MPIPLRTLFAIKSWLLVSNSFHTHLLATFFAFSFTCLKRVFESSSGVSHLRYYVCVYTLTIWITLYMYTRSPCCPVRELEHFGCTHGDKKGFYNQWTNRRPSWQFSKNDCRIRMIEPFRRPVARLDSENKHQMFDNAAYENVYCVKQCSPNDVYHVGPVLNSGTENFISINIRRLNANASISLFYLDKVLDK